MVIDTSAVLAILLDEPAAEDIAARIEADPVRLISAANALESALVIESRRGPDGGRDLDLLLHEGRIDIVPVTREHVEIARDAWRRFGKGRHPAALNFGDCLAYALAQGTGEALLFTGDGFSHTDVRPA